MSAGTPERDKTHLDVLIVNEYYPPDTSATAVAFEQIAIAIAQRGHKVTVIAGRPSYDPTERLPWRPILRQIRSGVRVNFIGSFSADRRKLKGRIVNYLSYLAGAAVVGVGRKRPDVVISGSDPPLAIVAALAAARGRPVIYSLRDLHPDAAVAAGMIEEKALVRFWDALHVSALRRGCLVVTLDEAMAWHVRAKGVDAERVVVVPDGAWTDVRPADVEIVGRLRDGVRFLAIHAGNLGSAGAWDALVEAQHHLPGDCGLLFVGDGIEAGPLRDKGVRVEPFLPAEQVSSVMAAGDIQIVCQKLAMGGRVMPSKLYPILAHGRPVLAVVADESEVARVVRHHQCGLVVSPDSPAAVASAIEWAANHPQALGDMGSRARMASRDYDQAVLLERFVSLVEEEGRRSRALISTT